MFRRSLVTMQSGCQRSLQHLFVRQISCSVLRLQQATDANKTKNLDTKTEAKIKWTPIYRYDNMQIVSTISNLKMTTALGGGLATLMIGTSEMIGLTPENYTLGFAIMSVASQIGLFLYSGFFANSIGFVYVCPKIKNVRMSYINFWGRRMNVEAPIEDLKLPESKVPFVLSLPFGITGHNILLQLRSGGCTHLQPEIVDYVFKSLAIERPWKKKRQAVSTGRKMHKESHVRRM